MSDPSSTYRLQFRNGMTFGRAAELAPYLVRLGISHVYGSPIFQAEPNSNHGYDVSDNRVLDRRLGGDASFESMIAAFHDAGLRFILDFVPNHMSASPRNPYWRDVLEWGQASDYAPFFDIDWSAPKLLVPVLGTSYGKALRAREFGLNFDEEDGSLTYTYRDLELPLTPTSYAQVLVREQSKESSDWARRFAVATPETSTELKANLATAAQNTTMRRALEQAIAEMFEDSAALHELHEMQCWRLIHWRAARETLTYRRFFEIADLVGLKVESPRVFDEIHGRLGTLVAAGSVSGVRIDHIDGLADPKAYLERLQKTFADDGQLYLLVEKILGPDEELRSDWPVAGTTGFYQALAGAWPPDLTLDHAAILAVLSDRMTEYMLKAVREAKVHTSWTDQNAEYEDAVENFTRAALDPARAQLFLRDFVSTCDIVFRAGAVNSLSQTAIKLAAPGVPDIYQGTELWDLSLVDPDNRRPVDFDYLHYLQQTIDAIPVTALAASWRNGAIKMRLLGAGLKLRTVARQVFENGDYLPLVVAGKAADHVLAFARLLGSDAVVVIVPRLCLGLLGEDDLPLVPRACWKSTTVQVSDKLAGRRFCDVVTGEMILAPFLLGGVLQHFPVALLATQLNGQARFAFPRSTAWISSRV